jgi:hypothetical protein
MFEILSGHLIQLRGSIIVTREDDGELCTLLFIFKVQNRHPQIHFLMMSWLLRADVNLSIHNIYYGFSILYIYHRIYRASPN